MKPFYQRTWIVPFVILTFRLLPTEGSLIASCSSMPPLVVSCSSNGVTGYAVVQCFRSNNIASITCSIDGGEEENCTLPLTLTAEEIGLGEHRVDITFTDVCGDTVQRSVHILWDGPLPPAECSTPPPLEAQCSIGGTLVEVTVKCYTSNNLESETCSIDRRDAEPCSFPLSLALHELGPGQHTLHVVWRDVCGQKAQTLLDFFLSYKERVLIEFQQHEYTTTEAAGLVEHCVHVVNAENGAFRNSTLSTVLTPGSSSVGDFAMACNNSLLFREGDIQKCYNVTILDDNLCEWNNGANEYFTSHLLDTSNSGIDFVQKQVQTYIDDSSEPECSIHVGYSRSEYTVSEDEGYIELCVQVTYSQRGAARPFSLSVFTSDGTAVNDTNYVAVAGEELLFPTGVEGETLCHNISIIKSDECSAAAGRELNFSSYMTSTAFNLVLDPSHATVVIDDHNETECGLIIVGYSTTYVVIDEMVEVVQLCAVVLSGEPPRPFNISVSTINSTADTSDYENVSGKVLVFNTTDSEQCHYINITDDMECEYDGCESEFFFSQLSTDDYNVQLVNSTAHIVIEDRTEDECEDIRSREDCDLTPSPSSSSSISDGVITVLVLLTVVLVFIIGITVIIYIYRWKTKKLQNYSKSWDKYVSSPPHANEATDLSIHSSAIQKLHQQLPKRMVFPKKQVHLSNTVGQGESGLVYKAYLNVRDGTQMVAVKTGKALFSTTDVNKLVKEVMTMLSFDHPNVMSLIGVCLNGEMPLLIMPFMANGSVLEYVKHHKEELLFTSEASEAQVMTSRKLLLGMCHQIAKGMEYLAQHKFVHRDLAARNCMIDLQGVIKVADFGLTEDMYGTNYYRREKSEEAAEERVPIRWMAPESIENDIYNEKTDVWSFGVTCWEVFTCGRVPYHGISALGLLAALKNGERLEKSNNIACSDEIHDTIIDCWYIDQQRRPKFSDLVQYISIMLEKEAGYLDLGQSLSWRKRGQSENEACRATVSTLQKIEVEEEGKVKKEVQESQ